MYYAAIALGVNPSRVHCPLAWSYRRATHSMPAHTDQDAPWRQLAYYICGLPYRREEPPGCRVYVCTGVTGGTILEFCSHGGSGQDVVVGYWDTQQSLHWVGSSRGAKGGVDMTGIRIISFDTKWPCGILVNEGRLRGVRMCPPNPMARPTITCSSCGSVTPSPDEAPCAWLEHLCREVQRAVKRPYVCLACMGASQLE